GNAIQNNVIGTDAAFDDLGNGGDGILISTGSSTTIGNAPGGPTGMGNDIEFNAGNGVGGLAGTSNSILGNSIFPNRSLGIDPGEDGVTPNDSEGHVGPNNFQNFPTLSRQADGSLRVALHSGGNSTYHVEVFSSFPTTIGLEPQGQTLIFSQDVATDS